MREIQLHTLLPLSICLHLHAVSIYENEVCGSLAQHEINKFDRFTAFCRGASLSDRRIHGGSAERRDACGRGERCRKRVDDTPRATNGKSMR